MSLARIAQLPSKVIRRIQHRRQQAVRSPVFPPIDTENPGKAGGLFIGYAEGALGLGQAFRSDLAAAAAVGMEFSIYPFHVNIEDRLLPAYMPERYDQTHIHDVNIIEIATEQLPVLYDSLNPELLKNSYNILRTYWELPTAPEEWRPHLAAIHEIWAPNTFIAESFAPIFNGPIKIIPPAVVIEPHAACPRSEFGLKDGRFYFLFSFDFHSSAHRKNPSAVLRAFQSAFPAGTENVGLVIKFNGPSERCPEFTSELRATEARDRRIITIDGHISREKMLSLLQATDAYVSLHRAEGFGLGMAEAMSLGKIVIGTGYSGNTDFLTEETGFPVPFAMKPVAPHEYAYSQGQSWAEPNIGAAAEIMRSIADHPAIAQERILTGKQVIKSQYSVIAVGERMKNRVAEITATHSRSKISALSS